MVKLVEAAELLWVVDHLEPAVTREIANRLPIDQNTTYIRLRHLDRRKLVTHETADDGVGRYRWSLTAAGRNRLADASLPPADETDFEDHFAGRAAAIDPVMVLEALAVREDEWQPSGAVYDALPFSKPGIRNNLHALRESGAVELDPGGSGTAHHWRLTDAGRDRLAEADDETPEYVWVD
ncbi:hypothetical protein SAMN05192561_10970 [Halopenitus malekzadehii]|uniref:Uncharacterized protein n=1 Tax=Halopenitus malekzadehii TaxID=1267564 RepID=A0A1H6J9V9_9EURY|nr:hypothetical protein [Halopenitus malekzadehii]SEH58558.1 hypothetical protein SAMN05192561_10970 [Halopenitus malekzadehii]